MQKVTVCKDCNERHIGCHVTCTKYNESKEQIAAMRKVINENKRNDMEYLNYKKSRKKKKGQR